MTTKEKYINAVFNFDAETFEHLLDSEPFDESLLADIGFAMAVPCPIQWFTQCWEIIFEHPEEWKEEYRDIIESNKRKNLEIKSIFEKRFNVKFEPIDFYNTDFWFFRNERDDTFEDVFDESRDSMISKGYRDIDLDLYVAVNKFDYKEVERLLNEGANPVCEFEEEGSYCMDRIGCECSHLEMELGYIIIHNNPCFPMEKTSNDIIYLMGLAAHETMYKLLSRYDLRPKD